LRASPNNGTSENAADKRVKAIRCKTHKRYPLEEKITITLAGPRGNEHEALSF
jgi:hypothetical protein